MVEVPVRFAVPGEEKHRHTTRISPSAAHRPRRASLPVGRMGEAPSMGPHGSPMYGATKLALGDERAEHVEESKGNVDHRGGNQVAFSLLGTLLIVRHAIRARS